MVASAVALLCVNANALKSDTVLENNIALQTIKHQKQVAWSMAPIKSKEALIELSLQKSPLDLLSDDSKQRFVESVIFRDDGVAGFHFSDLESELTPTEIYKVLSLIGAQNTVSKFKAARIETKQDLLLLSKPALETSLQKKISSSVGTLGYGRPPTQWDDHKGYYCSGRATCSEKQGDICMSSC